MVTRKRLQAQCQLEWEHFTNRLSWDPHTAHGCPGWMGEEAEAVGASLPHLDLQRGCGSLGF